MLKSALEVIRDRLNMLNIKGAYFEEQRVDKKRRVWYLDTNDFKIKDASQDQAGKRWFVLYIPEMQES
jgi:hypothetical protein